MKYMQKCFFSPVYGDTRRKGMKIFPRTEHLIFNKKSLPGKKGQNKNDLAPITVPVVFKRKKIMKKNEKIIVTL